MRNLLALSVFIFSSVAISDTAITVMSYNVENLFDSLDDPGNCLLYTSPSPRDGLLSRMPSSA